LFLTVGEELFLTVGEELFLTVGEELFLKYNSVFIFYAVIFIVIHFTV